MRTLLTCLIAAVVGGLWWQAGAQEPPKQPEASDAGQPATRPARTLRRPSQAEIIEGLLRERERSRIILPQAEVTPRQGTPGEGKEEAGLLLEGTILVERPGRLSLESGAPMFMFINEGKEPALQSMQLLPNQLLEAMEDEYAAGQSEFVISARVTRYRGRNYLLLLKVLRRVSHGNLGP